MIHAVTSQLHRLNGVLSPAYGVWLEVLVFIWIIVWNKSNTTSHERRVIFDHSLGNVEHPVRLIKTFIDYPRHVIHCHLHFGQFVTDAEVDGIHLSLHQPFHCPLDDVLSRIVHHTRRQLQQQCCCDDDGQAGMGFHEASQPLHPVPFRCVPVVHNFTIWPQS